MPANVLRLDLVSLMLAIGFAAPVHADPSAIMPEQTGTPAVQLAGTWILSLGKTASCRVILRPQRTDAGDYFLGMPAACRHAIPQLQAVGRWSMPDATHVTLDDPAGKPVLALAAMANGRFEARLPEGIVAMAPVPGAVSRSIGFDAVDASAAAGPALIQPVATKSVPTETHRETADDLAGRYAVMREKHDTGCMVTLDDKSHVKGGVRAQLAPGCRDQGIVIFDPSAWQLVKGQLVLIARAGHKAVLERKQEGVWEKDAKEGGKPLGLKKL